MADIKFSIIDEFAKEVAEKALDEFLYNGKSIREWMQIIASEDAISRQAVFEQINCWIGSGEYRYTNATDYLIKRIKALQTVNPQPKTGHWIDTDEWKETVDGFEQWGYFRKCSKCGYVFKFLEIDNYCPNCGARMESEVRNE